MRWQELFADLEGQLESEAARGFELEIADRIRRERAEVALGERLAASAGRRLQLRIRGAGDVAGDLADVGRDWLLLETGRRSAVVPFGALLAVSGCEERSEQLPNVARRFGLGYALRVLSRDRAVVRLLDVDGRSVAGTPDRVGSDHLDLAQHPADVPRRRGNVTDRLVVPFSAIAVVWSR
ncbi:hypothetical protein [Segeticoccus rhizosphaerae]|jgi:hypothetical protein|uniref:hypothetical protein n=1 Tax=Segeticoccus rhizosphaerae TaxID=1104777 RepID=UPI0010C123D9|nr:MULTISPECIES: hypothetical protein [Intrasporangiaceae]